MVEVQSFFGRAHKLLVKETSNPSIERTNTGKPVFASHLKR